MIRFALLCLLMAANSAGAYTVGGSVSGLTSTIVLRLNATTFHIWPSGSTSFAFNTQLNTGDAYSVVVGIQPVGQSCKVTNGLGVIGTSNITNIAVACVGTGSATLSWSKPTQNTDGSNLTDLAGYMIYYGTNPASLTATRIVAGANTLSTTISGLTTGSTYYFGVASRNTAGQVGPTSNLASKFVN